MTWPLSVNILYFESFDNLSKKKKRDLEYLKAIYHSNFISLNQYVAYFRSFNLSAKSSVPYSGMNMKDKEY